jgi:hypothetical protein
MKLRFPALLAALAVIGLIGSGALPASAQTSSAKPVKPAASSSMGAEKKVEKKTHKPIKKTAKKKTAVKKKKNTT